MTDLVCEIGLSLPIAFQLVRPLIRAATQSSDSIEGCPAVLRLVLFTLSIFITHYVDETVIFS
jgi:hypothetical protein